MLRQILNFTVQNKNFLMLITAIIYILGVFAYFTNLSIFLCCIISILGIIGISRNFISPKLVIFWIFVFYFGFIHCTFQIKNFHKLSVKAPFTGEIEVQVVSIPNSNFADRTKFFFQNKEGKTLVTVYSKS